MRIGIVTGGLKGIGKCLTRALVQHGPDLDELWVVSRSPLQVDLNICGGIPIRQIRLDISGPDSQTEFTALLHESGATVAFLIANAGVAEAFKVSDSVNDLRFFAATRSMVSTNIWGTVSIVYASLPFMGAQSKILIIGSISALVPTPGLSVYTSTKAFLRHWAFALREELRPRGISVTIAHPAKVRTEAVEGVVKQTGSIKLRLMPSQSCGYFARRGVRAAMNGKAEVTPGAYGLFAVLAKCLPAAWKARLVRL